MNSYAHNVSAPAGGKRLRIGVVGAGMTGLVAARTLSDQGHDVVVVDKARGAGGRMSTRRNAGLRFDHGAQYFTARDPRFLRHVVAWQERGLVAAWDARIATIGERDGSKTSQIAERFVAIPGMNAICRELAKELADCRFNWAVRKLKRLESGWILTTDEAQTLECDALVVTTPPEQARIMLADPEVDELINGVEMRPCWALMLVLDKPLFADHDAAFVNQGPLSWVSSQSSRPERPTANAWVLHASPEWSSIHLEKPADEVRDLLLEAARELPLAQSFTVKSAVTHRWRYALARQPLNCGAIWLGSKNLALAGDWCHGSRVEGAFLSGIAAAGRIMAGNGRVVTMDDFRRLEGDNWEGSLSYLNYGSDKRSTIPVKLAFKVLNEKALQYAIQYPGEDQHNVKERLKLSSDGTRINGYIITNREQTTDGTLILTTEGTGQDDNRSAEVQVIYEVAADRFSIRKNVRFKSSEAYLNRNEYSLRR